MKARNSLHLSNGSVDNLFEVVSVQFAEVFDVQVEFVAQLVDYHLLFLNNKVGWQVRITRLKSKCKESDTQRAYELIIKIFSLI